jgi:hypothetical protein
VHSWQYDDHALVLGDLVLAIGCHLHKESADPDAGSITDEIQKCDELELFPELADFIDLVAFWRVFGLCFW